MKQRDIIISILVMVVLLIMVYGYLTFNRLKLKQNEMNAIASNIVQIGTASQKYLQDKGVTQVTYRDLVGTGTDSYMPSLTPVAGEDYTSIIVSKTTTQIEIRTANGASVMFNL